MADEKKFSYVLTFDGKDDFVALPAMMIDYSQGFTVEAWVRWNSPKDWARVIDFGNGQGSDNILLANGNTRVLTFQVFNGPNSAGYHPEIVDMGLWIHVAGTVDAGGNMTVYKNGKPVASGNGNRPNNIRRTLNYLGKSNWAVNGYLDARMAELRIWNVARTQAQIEANQNQRLAGSEPGLVGYWPLDDGAGLKAKDRSPLGNDGVINGATWENVEVPFGPLPTVVQVPQTNPGLAVLLGQLPGESGVKVKAAYFIGDAKNLTGAKFVLIDDTEVTFACARTGDAGAPEIEYAFSTKDWKGKSASFTVKLKKASHELKVGDKSLVLDGYDAAYYSNIVFGPPAPAQVQVPALLDAVVLPPPLPSVSASGVVNAYASVVGISDKTIKLGTAPGWWRAGDRVLVIQMMGAEIDKTDTQSFGTLLKENSAGSYEWATIERASGNEITLVRPLACTYDPLGGRVQIVKVLVGSDVFVDGKVEPRAWDGSTGGVIAIEAAGTIDLKADIDASGRGFSGGAVSPITGSEPRTAFVYQESSPNGGLKGKGIAAIEPGWGAGRGAAANGGGGGNAVDSGGGGGGNGGAGGAGGKEWSPSTPNDNGGIGGRALHFSERMFMGGGGGGGSQTNSQGSAGSSGGGIVFLRAKSLTGAAGRVIMANGQHAAASQADGAGGGGAGGTIWLDVQTTTGAFSIEAKGGNGGSCAATHGPGGGGGGGAIVFANPLPSTVTTSLAGGKAGQAGTDPRGAADGSIGFTAIRACAAGGNSP